MRHEEPLGQRLMSQVMRADSGCWKWLGRIRKDGYGAFWDGKKAWLAHRLIFESVRGPVGKGLELDHLCRNRDCCNPDHLDPVTHRENLRRGARWQVSQLYCKQGHPLWGENLRIARSGYRACKTCNRLAVKRYQAKRRGATK